MQLTDKNGNVYGGGLQVTGPDGKPKTIGGGGGGTPSGPAGGDLSGTYPNPSVKWTNGLPTYNGYYYPLTNPSGFISGITSLDVTTALGFTPYSNTNPSGFITSSALSPYLTAATAASTYFPIPTGTTSEYIRGNGTLATFPTIPTVTPAALTKTDDTNVTITLGGTPSTALLQATSLTLGWTGTLADGRIASATTWNAKQDALVSGTNIKTINSTSLLGSENILINSSPILMPVNLTGVAVTNTLVNTISIGALTPATNFVNNATLQIRAKFFKTAGTSATTFRIYINTSNSLTGATLLGTAVNMTAASQFQLFNRDFFINGTTLRCFSATSPASTDIANFSVTNFTVTASTNYYFIIAIQHAAATDSATCLRFQIFVS